MSDREGTIDWTLTSWEGSSREQLRRALSLTVRERLEAVEELCERAEMLKRAASSPSTLSRPEHPVALDEMDAAIRRRMSHID